MFDVVNAITIQGLETRPTDSFALLEITEGLLQLSNNTTTRGHSLKLSSQPSRIEIRRNSFSVRVVTPWNSLLQEVVMSPSVKSFEARPDSSGKINR